MLRERLSDPGADPGDAFAAYVSARLRCAPAAVISPDLPRRLERSGVPADLAARTADLLERLVAVRYVGRQGARQAASSSLAGFAFLLVGVVGVGVLG